MLGGGIIAKRCGWSGEILLGEKNERVSERVSECVIGWMSKRIAITILDKIRL